MEAVKKHINTLNQIKNDYQSLFTTKIEFNPITIDGEQKELNRTTYPNLVTNPNQQNRKTVFDTYTSAYEQASQLIATLYINKLNNDIELATSEHYPTLLEKKLFELELPSQIVTELIKMVTNHIDIMHKYTTLKKKATGLKEYHIYDTNLSICQIPKMDVPLEEAIITIKESLRILGNDYIEIIDKMLEEGWIDVYPKPNKRTMSFTCISYIGVPYILINYDSSINSARTLAHEIGHAIHTYYSKTNNSFEDFQFSYFLTEIASKVNELLVNDYMLKHCQNQEQEKYLLNNTISSTGNSIFGQIMLTEFEHQIITKLEQKETITTQDLNHLYQTLSKKYNGDDFTYDDNIQYGWSKIPHFIMQDTYYVYQYAIGTMIATNLAYRIQTKEPHIIDKYKQFLSLGNSVSIIEALKIVDIDLGNSDYIKPAIQELDQKINRLNKLI